MQQHATPTHAMTPGGPAHLAHAAQSQGGQATGPASLMLVQDQSISIDPDALRDMAMRAAELGLRQALAQQQGELQAARARGDEEAIARLEAQIAEMEAGIARVEAEVAEAQADAGASGGEAVTVVPALPPPPPVPNALPDGVVAISLAFFAVIVLLALGLPIARAFGRRGARTAVAAPDPETQRELRDIRHAVEAIAIEVERISEGQRFLGRLQQDAPGDPVPVEQRSAR